MARRKKRSIWGSLIIIVLFALFYNIILGLALIACLIGIGYWWFKKKYLIRVSTINELMNLSPSEFERAIATLLTDLGYRDVKVTGGAGDLGRDITCRDMNGRTVMVQCKRYSRNHPVGSPEIQLFIGMLITEYKADRGIYVTTSYLTQPAMKLAHKHGIEVWDRDRLADLLAERKRRIKGIRSRIADQTIR